MRFFKNKKNKYIEKEKLEELVNEKLEDINIPKDEYGGLKSRYYIEFQKKEQKLYKNDPFGFWIKASKYAENKLRKHKYKKNKYDN